MKKILGIFFLAIFVFASCATPPARERGYAVTGITGRAALAVQDFEPVGIIFVNSTEVIDSAGNHTGSRITSEMLMREAERLGAHDVINVRIDVVQRDETIAGAHGAFINRTTFQYTATALAIRFTGALADATASFFVTDVANITATAPEPPTIEQVGGDRGNVFLWLAGIAGAGLLVGIITALSSY